MLFCAQTWFNFGQVPRIFFFVLDERVGGGGGGGGGGEEENPFLLFVDSLKYVPTHFYIF
jgi:hypothetical protein